MDKKALNELHELLSRPSIRNMLHHEYSLDRQVVAKNMRNEIQADWLQNVMDRMYVQIEREDQKHINNSTGHVHTVESMTAEYRKQIGLDALLAKSETDDEALEKAASLQIPISKKQATELVKKKDLSDEKERSAVWSDIIQHIGDHLSSHRGYADAPAIVYELRDVFGGDVIEQFAQELSEEIVRQKSQYDNDDIHNQLPKAPMGQPQKVDHSLQEQDQIFQNIEKVLK